eukprot:15042420-Alexandrium_andersonii.AAC.1
MHVSAIRSSEPGKMRAGAVTFRTTSLCLIGMQVWSASAGSPSTSMLPSAAPITDPCVPPSTGSSPPLGASSGPLPLPGTGPQTSSAARLLGASLGPLLR